ncbi:putative serine esterase-domain-containing protein [Tricharina praecox]|uniref:putative serine esterase-domain-containing protein n=1 Tax=Tricharina praecox TaxID=43433 RepID=UPI002220A822|nr:putative serine esterase-domain-containing protein [Tricharina praecox]KAI5854026.1 putative serine esterase-domain-containing protein [Tricharina praecox]
MSSTSEAAALASPAAPAAQKGDHLCVFVHGLWGNPGHLQFLSDTLRACHDESVLQILVCKNNAGHHTYDGIETGGERVAKEIEDLLEQSASEGVEIRKISVVGYSLGGLVLRYAIGLLYSKGCFQKIQPVNFTTFASPYLGVRIPLLGWHNHIWNVLAARTLSESGRQLFMIDKFRGTDRPLLSVLADKNSVFYKGLAMFANKALYANVTNDRTTSWYTSAISRHDPFADLSAVTVKYLPKYAPVILDPEDPVQLATPRTEDLSMSSRIARSGKKVAKLPMMLVYIVIVPIGISIFLANSVLQGVLSKRRIRLHGNQKEWHGYQSFPLLAEEIQEATDHAIEDMHHELPPQHLPPGSKEQGDDSDGSESEELLTDSMVGITNSVVMSSSERSHDIPEKHRDRHTEFPTLALHPLQFRMIHNLDSLNIKKFPVWIHNIPFAHAAIVVRRQTESYNEGKVVAEHWIKEVFQI